MVVTTRHSAAPPMVDCDGTVPIVSRRLAQRLLARIPRQYRELVVHAAIAWLEEQHPGLSQYNGIQGRKHTDDELAATGRELAAVAALPCPFRTGDGSCLVGGLSHLFNRVSETSQEPYAFLPVHVAKEWVPDTFRRMVRSCVVADAKSVYLNANDKALVGLHASGGGVPEP